MKSKLPILEKDTQGFIDKLASKKGKPIYEMTPEEARAFLEKMQSGFTDKLRVDTEDKTIPVGPNGQVSIKIFRPQGNKQALPVLMYFHGAGWVMGSHNTFDHLARLLAIKAKIAVVFVNYSLSPEAQFPIAIEEAYAATQYISEHGKQFNLDSSRIAIGGDSVGGNMTIAVSMLAKERKGPKFLFQLLFYPVTDAKLNSNSYKQYAKGPWLTKAAMEWFWNAYEPKTSARKNPLMSPLEASIEQIKDLPSALVVTAEHDVLRDEGEAYAHKLTQAGVQVTATRFLGTIHDFLMINDLAHTPAAQGAINLATIHLHQALYSEQEISISKVA
ncbi:alpha/beta hydrolase fold domain-containing protein [Simkania negevensis]|uniref:Putative alpha/beta hydrolase R526 n=1 Tax=Simkania negevensis (strain ATCC VR-1471 / DSM 27360 / Z) TaxID=331113 RepID=F8L913_SIMNZ|nr:alpha/beta hydrolase fold domain-containing protein [Simkania negevensis]CCB89323.1 putative alpha/beta hydrolase R526 [Simkania negevensis Z]